MALDPPATHSKQNLSGSRDICTSEKTAYSLDKRLYDIQKSVAETQNAILSQNNAVHCILRFVPCSHERQLSPSGYRTALPEHTLWGLPRVSPRVDLHCDTPQGRSHTASEVLPEQKESPEPQSLFEMSANFFPEIYTTDQRLPRSCLVVISSNEEHLGENSKRNLYRLFYLNRPRQWCRIDISIQMPRRSKYWAASKTSQDEWKTMETRSPEVYAPLPYSLITQIQTVIMTFSSVEQVCTCLSKTIRLQ